MKRRVLILGGSRFIGRRFVETYSSHFGITIANRGNSNQWVPESVRALVVDRFDKESLATSLGGTQWDVVIDSLCYSASDARILLEAGLGFDKLVCISSRAVYEGEGPFKEQDFDPTSYAYDPEATVAFPLQPPKQNQISYGEGKRQAEACYSQHIPSKAIFLRFPIVIGENDYTQRVEGHLEALAGGKPLFFGPAAEQRTSFVDVNDAADTLAMSISSLIPGAYNIASEAITLVRFAELLEEKTGEKVPLADSAMGAFSSPFAISSDESLDCSLIKQVGMEPVCIVESFRRVLSLG